MHLSRQKLHTLRERGSGSGKGHANTQHIIRASITVAVRRAMIDACSRFMAMTEQFLYRKWKMLWKIMIRQFDLAQPLIKQHQTETQFLPGCDFLRHHDK